MYFRTITCHNWLILIDKVNGSNLKFKGIMDPDKKGIIIIVTER